VAIHVERLALDVAPSRLAELRATLAPDEHARAARLRFARDADRFVAGRGLLRVALGARVGEDPARLRFAYGTAGKPSLADHPDLRFNVSGAGGVGLLAMADGIELGVDVELAGAAYAGLDVARQFFARDELAALRALDPAARPLAFLRCWTRKEAYVKAHGDGLQISLDAFAVTLRAEDPVEIAWHESPGEAARWGLVDLSDTGDGIVGALCHAVAPGDGIVGVTRTR
jgi:4'-phosphopantetheinyl transferase